MAGNELDTDANGYFKDQSEDNAIKSHILSRIGSTLQTGTLSKQKIELEATSNCWICEGWS